MSYDLEVVKESTNPSNLIYVIDTWTHNLFGIGLTIVFLVAVTFMMSKRGYGFPESVVGGSATATAISFLFMLLVGADVYAYIFGISLSLMVLGLIGTAFSKP